MGMSADHFVVDGRKNIGGSKLVLFRVQIGQHGQDKKYIADFFTNILMAAMVNGLNQFLAFFQEIFFQRQGGLFDIPGATLLAPKRLDNM